MSICVKPAVRHGQGRNLAYLALVTAMTVYPAKHATTYKDSAHVDLFCWIYFVLLAEISCFIRRFEG